MREQFAMYHQISKLLPSELAEKLSDAKRVEGAQLLQELIEEEQELSLLNLLKAYEDKVPQVLQMMDVSSIVALFEELDDYHIMKALFGNFRAVDEEKRQKILEGLSRRKAALLLNRMSIGVDNPKTAAKILQHLPIQAATEVADAMEIASVIRILREMPIGDRGRMMTALTPERAADIAKAMLGSKNMVRRARLTNILKQLDDSVQQLILSKLEPEQRQGILAHMQRSRESEFDTIDPREAMLRVDETSPEELATELDKANPEKMLDILKLCDAGTAAQVLTVIAQHSPQKVADLLEEFNEKIIVGFRGSGIQRSCVEEIYMCPAAGILESMDLSLETNINALRLMRGEVLKPILDRMPEEKRAEITSLRKDEDLSVKLPVSLQLFTVGKGTRKTVDLGHGLKWTRIKESLDTGEKVKPVIIDLVEMDPRKVTVKACRAISEDNLMPITELAKLFGDAKREGKRPDKALFSKLGLIQLNDVVRRSGAIAAINGNHYYDYGHYMDAIKLGIDPTKVPGLFFGDPVGWFVADGREISPPAFNRAALVVTKDGNAYIERVFMTDVTLGNGVRVRWDATNSEKREGLTILYNSLYGFKTNRSQSHIDIAIARDRIFEIKPGGGGLIPFTGFVLAVPVENEGNVLSGVKAGDTVRVGNNFPASLGKVEQAMACGPYLVRSGQLEISFEAEDFGEKDSSVMAFSLTRAVETFEAARSFVMLRGNRLFIGTVSGTALGTGISTESAGMTFGELAQLAMDLRADHAYALDGGGSSSIAVRVGEEVCILNTPTGGSDVAKGEERFINTHWLFFEREN